MQRQQATASNTQLGRPFSKHCSRAGAAPTHDNHDAFAALQFRRPVVYDRKRSTTRRLDKNAVVIEESPARAHGRSVSHCDASGGV